MEFFVIDSLCSMQRSRFGIMEPTSTILMQNIDIAVVPGLAFTKDGIRLGYGGGYYDRYFEYKASKLCAICFDEQIVENIPCEQHDLYMDFIVSDKRTIRINR